jgi:hypothetical protein
MRALFIGSAATFAMACAGSALALETSTASVKCSSSVKLQDKIDGVKAGTIATFNVTGTCNENLVIPKGKTIIIAGSSGAKITPAKTSVEALISNGDTTISGMTIENKSGTASTLVLADRGGYLEIIASTLSAPKSEYVAAFYNGSAGRISNSRVTGGTGGGIDLWDSSSLKIFGHPDDASGPDGFKTTISSPTGPDGAIGCGLDSSVFVRAHQSGSKSGAILLNDSMVGLSGGHQCVAYLSNKTGKADNFKITGMEGPGISLSGSTLTLRGVKVTGNGGGGLELRQTNAEIRTASSLSSNADGDVNAGPGSNVFVNGWDGKNSMSDAFNKETLKCWTGGIINIDGDALSLPSGKTMTDLLSKNPCVNPD